MPKTCVVPGCGSRSLVPDERSKFEITPDRISFHVFPLHKPELLRKWLNNIRRLDYTPRQLSYICSLHFKSSDFIVNYASRRMLKTDCVPSLFNFQKVKTNSRVALINKIRKTISLRNKVLTCSSFEPSVVINRIPDLDNLMKLQKEIMFKPCTVGQANDATLRQLSTGTVCCSPICENHLTSRTNLSTLIHYSFPFDVVRCKKWLHNSQLKTCTPIQAHKQQLRLCSMHFTPESFNVEMSHALLSNAVPTVYANKAAVGRYAERCCISQCPANGNPTIQIYPLTGSRIMKSLWVDFAERHTETYNNVTTICKLHFSEYSFTSNTSGDVILHRNAVPTLYDPSLGLRIVNITSIDNNETEINVDLSDDDMEIQMIKLSITCPLCQKTFDSRGVLAQHITHCQKYPCPLCHKNFASVEDLSSHLKNPICSVVKEEPPEQEEDIDNSEMYDNDDSNQQSNNDIISTGLLVKQVTPPSSAISISHRDHCYTYTDPTSKENITKQKERKRQYSLVKKKEQVKVKRLAVKEKKNAELNEMLTILNVKLGEGLTRNYIKGIKMISEYIIFDKLYDIEVLKVWGDDARTAVMEKINKMNDTENERYVITEPITFPVNLKDGCFKCICCELPVNLEHLQHHFPSCKKFETLRMCHQCGRRDFLTLAKVKEHEKECIEIQPLRSCHVCKKIFTIPSRLRKHMSDCHSNVEGCFVCSVCNKSFKRSTTLQSHKASKHGIGRKLCSFCGKDFSTTNKLNSHVRCIHTLETPYQCDICGRKLARVEDLAVHRRRVSQGLLCPKTKLNWTKDKRSASSGLPFDKNGLCWKCHICSRFYRLKEPLMSHVYAHYHGLLKEKCTDCGQMFQNKIAVNTHRQKGHNVETASKQRPKILDSAEIEKLKESYRYFPCNTCDKVFLTKIALNAHAKIHDKQFICQNCPRKFAYRKTYMIHMKLHQTNDCHSCNLCGSTYRTNRSLLMHAKNCSVNLITNVESYPLPVHDVC